MESWENKIEVQKGNHGEQIVRDMLEKEGWIVYEPKTNGAHAFDKLCVKDKKHICIVEVKTKARMTKYNATGFNRSSYRTYNKIQEKYGIEIFLFFVDEFLGKVYGQSLSILKEPYYPDSEDVRYPMIIGNTVVFSLEKMEHVANLSDDDCEYLKEKSSRNYDYPEVSP